MYARFHFTRLTLRLVLGGGIFAVGTCALSHLIKDLSDVTLGGELIRLDRTGLHRVDPVTAPVHHQNFNGDLT